jgi:hypothetical protein
VGVVGLRLRQLRRGCGLWPIVLITCLKRTLKYAQLEHLPKSVDFK